MSNWMGKENSYKVQQGDTFGHIVLANKALMAFLRGENPNASIWGDDGIIAKAAEMAGFKDLDGDGSILDEAGIIGIGDEIIFNKIEKKDSTDKLDDLHAKNPGNIKEEVATPVEEAPAKKKVGHRGTRPSALDSFATEQKEAIENFAKEGRFGRNARNTGKVEEINAPDKKETEKTAQVKTQEASKLERLTVSAENETEKLVKQGQKDIPENRSVIQDAASPASTATRYVRKDLVDKARKEIREKNESIKVPENAVFGNTFFNRGPGNSGNVAESAPKLGRNVEKHPFNENVTIALKEGQRYELQKSAYNSSTQTAKIFDKDGNVVRKIRVDKPYPDSKINFNSIDESKLTEKKRAELEKAGAAIVEADEGSVKVKREIPKNAVFGNNFFNRGSGNSGNVADSLQKLEYDSTEIAKESQRILDSY